MNKLLTLTNEIKTDTNGAIQDKAQELHNGLIAVKQDLTRIFRQLAHSGPITQHKVEYALEKLQTVIAGDGPVVLPTPDNYIKVIPMGGKEHFTIVQRDAERNLIYTLQSYGEIVAQTRPAPVAGRLVVLFPAWNYSATTRKYVYKFIETHLDISFRAAKSNQEHIKYLAKIGQVIFESLKKD